MNKSKSKGKVCVLYFTIYIYFEQIFRQIFKKKFAFNSVHAVVSIQIATIKLLFQRIFTFISNLKLFEENYGFFCLDWIYSRGFKSY